MDCDFCAADCQAEACAVLSHHVAGHLHSCRSKVAHPPRASPCSWAPRGQYPGLCWPLGPSGTPGEISGRHLPQQLLTSHLWRRPRPLLSAVNAGFQNLTMAVISGCGQCDGELQPLCEPAGDTPWGLASRLLPLSFAHLSLTQPPDSGRVIADCKLW